MKWQSADDGFFPDNRTSVLVWVDDYEVGEFCDKCWFEDGEFIADNFDGCDVTYWMPLPKPPTKDI